MNSLLSITHTINNHSQSLNLLNKHAADVNNKITSLEEKVKKLEKISDNFLNSDKQDLNEVKIKSIIKDHLNAASLKNQSEINEDKIKNIVNLALKNSIDKINSMENERTKQTNDSLYRQELRDSPSRQELRDSPSRQEHRDSPSRQELRDSPSILEELEHKTSEGYDDIVIQEKPKKTAGRKPKK